MRHVTWKGLPRVMVMTLAMDKRDQKFLLDQIADAAVVQVAGPAWADAVNGVMPPDEYGAPLLARIFAAILELEQPERAEFATFYDHLLERQGDLFGTEGQNDPRGDRRDYE